MFTFKDPQNRSSNYSLSEIALKSGFKFRDIENRRLDWKTLGCVDVNKVVENQDYEFLEKITPKIIEAPMQSILGTAAIDPAVSSLFRLAQMSLQYMSFCQQFMSHTLYDLRTAFNHIQKKYSNLKYNYKCLEEQHYKAQERIQTLLKEIKGHQNTKENQLINSDSKPSSLYPCDQCTKNFLTSESLNSHQQRKHSDIEEKHELSDDNEKQNDDLEKHSLKNEPCLEQVEAHKPVDLINNNNNNDNETNANCTECFKKTKITSSSVAIQCEAKNIQSGNIGIEKCDESLKENEENEEQAEHVDNTIKKLDGELIQSAHDTIEELKKEIVELKNSLEAKAIIEIPKKLSENVVNVKDAPLLHTNDKIYVIEQKFNAFEAMYTDSQQKFIESFRNLDERQKIYMDNIQETVKEIVEKSLGEHESNPTNNGIYNGNSSQNRAETTKPFDISDGENQLKPSQEKCQKFEEKKPEDSTDSRKNIKNEQSQMKNLHELEQKHVDNTSSSSEDEHNTLTLQAEVHRTSLEELNSSDQRKNTKLSNIKITKEYAINELEQRLSQLGVNTDSTGLPNKHLGTPRFCEVNRELTEERREMKRAHKSFDITRRKLKGEVDRISKEKMLSGSSMTSLSSMSYQSDDQILQELHTAEKPPETKVRAKSASIQNMKKREAKKLMNKFVENDIDEDNIIGNMKMAQKAINSHRECIQQLLQTTAHSPSSLSKSKHHSSIEKVKPNLSGETSESATNRFNKMPNVTTRRVVFVNLDEDS